MPETRTEIGAPPSDPGAARSAWIAGAIVLAIVLWMGSGLVLPQTPDTPPVAAADPEPAAVLVRPSRAREVTLTITAEGQALPDRDTEIRAEASGIVARLSAQKGQDVTAGTLIAELAPARAEADLVEAQADARRAVREFDNASQLLDRGIATADRVAEARAALAAAQARVTSAEQALEDLRIVAPFDGRIESLSIETGEYASAGESVARMVDNSPLSIAIQVPQQSLNRIERGQKAAVEFITGQSREGIVAFVGTAAASDTRTFLVEIEVDNPDGAIPAGVSAEVVIPTGTAMAHAVPTSVVSLGPDGELGIKTVDDENRVVVNEIEIVRADADDIWVEGLPDAARIITVGQGFVQAGETVRPSEPESGTAQPDDALAADGAAR